MTGYVLSSVVEPDRLQVQARLWEPHAEALLDRVGVQPGWHCLDVGCGAMGILGPLSRRVGPAGRVVGIDKDQRLLAAARRYAAGLPVPNVEVLEADARATGLPRASFDLTHIRFTLVFGHMQAIFDEMLALTRPGGWVVLQETDHTSWNFYPPRPVWHRLRAALEGAFVYTGGNAYFGLALPGLARAAGLQAVGVSAAVVAVHDCHPYMRMPIIGAQGFRSAIVAAGILTEAELDATLAEMEAMINDPETWEISFTAVQVWGRKPLE